MTKRRVATNVIGAIFCALLLAFLLTLNPWLFVASLVAQVAMFMPEWGGRK